MQIQKKDKLPIMVAIKKWVKEAEKPSFPKIAIVPAEKPVNQNTGNGILKIKVKEEDICSLIKFINTPRLKLLGTILFWEIAHNAEFTWRLVTLVSLFQPVKPICVTKCARSACPSPAKPSSRLAGRRASLARRAEHARSRGTAASAAGKFCCVTCYAWAKSSERIPKGSSSPGLQ